LLTTSAGAQYLESDASLYGYRDHTGMYSHVGLGLGYAAARADYDFDAGSPDVEQSGVAYQIQFSLGGSVMPGLAVHFSYFGFDSIGTSLKVNGKEAKGEDADLAFNAIGAGVTYYLPSNFYVGGSGGLALVSVVDREGYGYRLDPGFGAQASVGYEWWVSREWGLGVALASSFFRATDDSEAGDETWFGYAISPVFSATMN
jgi:hypothetical protein